MITAYRSHGNPIASTKNRVPWELPLPPSHVRRAYVLPIRIDVLNQRPVVHYELQRMPSSPVRRGVMTQCKGVSASVALSKCHARKWPGDECGPVIVVNSRRTR